MDGAVWHHFWWDGQWSCSALAADLYAQGGLMDDLTEELTIDTVFPHILQGMTLEEAKRRMVAALRVLTEEGYTLTPQPEVCFVVIKPDGWRRHQVVCTAGGHHEIVERFWSWDRANDLATRLNAIRRTLA
jgi:hypothetical protein